VHNVSICVRAGLSKPRPVPDTERNKDTKTLDYASTPLDANTLLGAGGLGCPVLQYLVAAGVGHIAIFDHDNVSLSNLQRQILYTAADLNQPKAQVAAEKLRALNQHVQIDPFANQLNASNVLGLLKGFQLIIDCTDNFPTRYLLNDASVLLDVPLIYASIFRYEGQVAVFNYQRSANYRDLYPLPPHPEAVPNCEEGGVLGALAGIIGSMQANEAIKVLAGIGDPLVNKLLILDSFTMDSQIIQIVDKNQRKNILGLIDYDDFCNAPKKNNSHERSNCARTKGHERFKGQLSTH